MSLSPHQSREGDVSCESQSGVRSLRIEKVNDKLLDERAYIKGPYTFI